MATMDIGHTLRAGMRPLQLSLRVNSGRFPQSALAMGQAHAAATKEIFERGSGFTGIVTRGRDGDNEIAKSEGKTWIFLEGLVHAALE